MAAGLVLAALALAASRPACCRAGARTRATRAAARGARSPRPPPPPELPRGGRELLPQHRVVAFYGAPGRRRARRAGHRLAGQRRAPARPPGAAVRAQDAAGAARARADRGDRQRRPGRRRHVPHAPAERGHPPLPARRPAPQDAARARHPARPLATSSPRRRGCERWLREPDVGLALDPEWRVRRRQVPGPGDRPGRLARGQRDLGLARAAGRPRRPARRSCSSCTSSPRTWSTTRSSSGAPHLAMVLNADGFGSAPLKIAKYRAFTRAAPGVPSRLQALLRGGRRAHDAARAVMRLRPAPDVVVYE